MKTIRILSGLFAAAALMLVLPATAQAASQLTNAKNTLLDPRAQKESTHTFQFTLNSSSNFQEFRFDYCTTPSGDCTKPANLNTTTAADGSLSSAGGRPITDGAWSLINATNGRLRYVHTGAGESLDAGTILTIPFKTVTNHAIDDCQKGGQASTDTCYVRIYACSVTDCAAQNVVANAIVSYTVVEAVTVTARVDPTFTFVVTAVSDGEVHGGVTTSVASTYSTLPFSNLTAGTPKYAAHQLNVTTNTQSGYTVSMAMIDDMSGVYTANNIDPYAGNGATWNDPQPWTSPNGNTPNEDTAWIGANTTDVDVSQFASGKFGPVNSSQNIVMSSTTSDNGATAVYVTYAIEANVRQPADTYTGTLVYNALPTY